MTSSSSSFFLFFLLLHSASASSQWNTFINLTNYRLGDTNPILHDLKTYLRHFGYLHPSNFTDSFDDNLHTALSNYQQNFNLNVTGILDLPTIHTLIAPRCGVPDIINGTTTMSRSLPGRRLYSYFSGQPRWPSSKRHLTYAIISPSTFRRSVLRPVFARAFDRWAEVTDMSFSELNSGDADIKIGFYSGDHGDGEAFDGPLRTLAHSFAPTDGRFHLDAAEEWVAEGDVTEAEGEYAIDVESVAVHEIGHLLGMGHSSVKAAIMYPSIAPRTKKVELHEDDIEGVRNLYGLH